MIVRIRPSQVVKENNGSTNEPMVVDDNGTPPDNIEVCLKKNNKTTCKERLGYQRVMDTIGQGNDGTLIDIPGSKKGIKWTLREQMAWLICYDREPPYNKSYHDAARWKQFSQHLAREFDIFRPPLQCRKQVMATLVI